MQYKTFLTLHGVIYMVFALALFFLPMTIWPLYGMEINDKYAYFLSQHTSIFLGGLAAMSLFFRNINDSLTIRQVLKTLVATNLLGVVITSYAGLIGIFVGFGWSDPAFFMILTLMSYLQLKKQANNL